jgi:hypothetical protein
LPISKSRAKEVRNEALLIFAISLIFLLITSAAFFSGAYGIFIIVVILSVITILSGGTAFITHILYLVSVDQQIIVERKVDEEEEPETEVKPAIAMPYGARVAYSLVFPDGSSIRELGSMYREFGRKDFESRLPKVQYGLISRKHFAIKASIDGNQLRYYIRDLGSRNGTLLNGVDIRDKGWIEIKDGDIISPAAVINLVFRVES